MAQTTQEVQEGSRREVVQPVELTRELRKALKVEAALQDRTMLAVLCEAVEQYLTKQDAKRRRKSA